MAGEVLKTSEGHPMNFWANPKFRFSKPPLHKYLTVGCHFDQTHADKENNQE